MQLCVSHYIHVDIKKEISFCGNHHMVTVMVESWLDKSDFSSHLKMDDVTVWDKN